MGKKQIVQLSQIGRNDPCPCGSGKKYKKCCLPKDEEKERLEREHENVTDVTDEYFSTKEYIEESSYPIIMFDLLLLEMLNIIGEILQSYQEFSTLENRETLSMILKKARKFYSGCQQCEYACLSHPMRTISFKSLIEKGLRIEQIPIPLQRPVSANFFYLEFINDITWNLSEETSKIISKDKAEHIATIVHRTLLDYIADNCWADCDNKCLKEHRKSAYCDFCNFGTNSLPCPRKEEITYDEIKAREEDMMQ
jgi:hypothetical protein